MGIGDATIVWQPAIDVQAIKDDTQFTVKITGISGIHHTEAEYVVTVIDPFLISPLEITGPKTASINRATDYRFSPFTGADRHDFRFAKVEDHSWVEGGENPAGPVVDATHANLPFSTTR